MKKGKHVRGTILLAIALLALLASCGGGGGGGKDMVFASEAIGKGEEGSVKLKNEFNFDDAIYARAYLPKKLEDYGAVDSVSLTAFVDGEYAHSNAFYFGTDYSLDQFQIYIRNTDAGDDLGQGFIKDLEPGTYTITILVNVNLEAGWNDDETNEKIKAQELVKGSFELTVK